MDTERIFGIKTPGDFEACALETFAGQYSEVPVYREFCDHLGKTPHRVRSLEEIPHLPLEFFKTRKVLRKGKEAEIVFSSSGTTGSTLSRHYVADLRWYRESFHRAFAYFYGPPSNYCLLAVLPSYQERPGSSLIYMVNGLIARSGHPESRFAAADPQTLYPILDRLEDSGQRVLLLGVSYALLDLALAAPRPLKNTVVMETGGMKGRRKEMVREELHGILCEAFSLEAVHSEYGMTELLSQAYSDGNGRFRCPPWMQVRMRDTEDPLSYVPDGRTGGVNVIDLANQHSCSFLATQDLGRSYADGHFSILGRFDHSDIRGCNLMAL